MNYELIQSGNNVDFLLNETFFCSIMHVNKKTDTLCFSESSSITISENENYITVDFSNESFDVISFVFPNIKRLNETSYYQEINGELITIECENATLVSNKSLAVSVLKTAKIVFEKSQSSFSTMSVRSMSATTDLIFEKRPPSFSITF
jgi:hypothetical protein